MERFYLENAALHRNLVSKFDTPLSMETTVTNTPAMVVAARIRPLSEEDLNAGFPCATFRRRSNSNIVDVHDLYNHPRGRPILKSSNHEVDRLFDWSATSEEIYDSLVSALIPFARNGGIGTLFTYGQTGSGKTFTVSRMQQLVAASLIEDSGERETYLTIVELAGNSAFDLLDSRKVVSILDDSSGNTHLSGATEHEIHSQDQMVDLIECAATFRRTEPTQKNDVSSRSHCICRIRVVDPIQEGLIYLVDLAGSEIARDSTSHNANRMRETREINVSLSVLKDCIRGKAESDLLKKSKIKSKRTTHIPFRQSALTRVLKHVFDPAEKRACKTIVIACLNPSLADVTATKNTLRYAEMMRVLVPIEHPVPRFTDHIRPGMVVSWRRSSGNITKANECNMAAILCPASAVRAETGTASSYIMANDSSRGNDTSYLCALFSKSPTIDVGYELDLRQQLVIDVNMMDREVVLEYNTVDRVYNIKS